MSDTRTLGEVRTRALRLVAMENETDFAVAAFVNDLINQGYKELVDELRAAYGNEYWRKSSSISVVAGTATYALPIDFLTMLLVEVVDSSGYRYPLRSFMMQERPMVQNLGTYGLFTPLNGQPMRWRLGRRSSTAIQQIEFSPTPTQSLSVEIEYLPVFPQLINDTDLLEGTNGWDDFVVWYTVVGLLTRDNSDPSAAMAEKEKVRARIQSLAGALAQTEPERVVDVENAFMAWWY